MGLFKMSSADTSCKKAAAVALFSVLALGACSEESREQAMETATEQLKLDEEDVFSLKPGMCFDNPREDSVVQESDDTQSISSIPVRECNEPHDNEAFYAYNLPDAPTYVETEESDNAMFETCSTEFEKYVGIPYDDSHYEMSVYTPSTESWADGDREILCYVFDPDNKKLEQSVKGIKK